MSAEFDDGYSRRMCSTKVHTASVDIFSDFDLGEVYQRLKAANNPIIYDYDAESTHNGYRVVYEDSPSSKRNISLDKSEIEVSYPRSEMRRGELLFSLAYPLLESQLQAGGHLTCHAACVQVEDQGILLLGPNGSGKTSVVLDLCKNYGGRLVGNNTCIIGLNNQTLETVKGTKPITLRQASVLQNMPDLNYLFPEKSGDPWTEKVSVKPEDIGIDTVAEPVVVNSAYLLHVDNTLLDLYQSRANKLDDKLYLYDNFSRIIRLTGLTPLVGSDYQFASYLPSLDTEDYYNQRVSIINFLQEVVSLSRLSGSLERVTNFIFNRAKEIAT